MIFKFFIIFCLYLSLPLLSDETCGETHGEELSQMSLKEKLTEAEPGSYLVLEQNKTYTFLHVFGKGGDRLSIEEVTIPASAFGRGHIQWKEWFENGAPGHSSWTLSQINLMTGQFEESYSFNHESWIDLSSADNFMTTLLNLCFQKLNDAQRRKVGLPPGHGKPDRRPLWNPKLIVEGVWIKAAPFTAWKARWPHDGSELSGKTIEIYLPVKNESVTASFPQYFPYWLEVEGKIGSARVRVVDSGISAHSPKSYFPSRATGHSPGPNLINLKPLQKEHLAQVVNK